VEEEDMAVSVTHGVGEGEAVASSDGVDDGRGAEAVVELSVAVSTSL